MQYIIKRCISHFSNRNFMDRYPFIACIYHLLTSFGDKGNPLPLVKDTAQVTYNVQKNMSVSEIARSRADSQHCIYSFYLLIPKYKLDLDEIVPKERIAGI